MAQGGSVIGLLVVGNMIYKGLAPGGKVKLVALLLAVCAAVPLALSLGPEVLPRPLVVPLAVLWGLAYALPFYIPPGEFVMQIGGKSATGLFSNLFDAAGLARLKTRQVAAATMHLWLRHSVGRRASPPSWRCVPLSFLRPSPFFFFLGGLHLLGAVEPVGVVAREGWRLPRRAPLAGLLDTSETLPRHFRDIS